jgi:hypothetical protein
MKSTIEGLKRKFFIAGILLPEGLYSEVPLYNDLIICSHPVSSHSVGQVGCGRTVHTTGALGWVWDDLS